MSSIARQTLSLLTQAPKGLILTLLRRKIPGLRRHELHALQRRGWIREIARNADDQQSNVTRRGGLVTEEALQPRETNALGTAPETTPLPLHLQAVVNRLETALDTGRHETILLQGPAADRWNLLLRVAELSLARHRPVLVVAPEVARASTIAALLYARWGPRVALLHSELRPKARAEVWHGIQVGRTDIVVGTRSAVFAPLGSMGLIYVDGEEDLSLKEEQEPRYHAREVASMRAHLDKAVLLLGSSHPSLETLASVDPGGHRPNPESRILLNSDEKNQLHFSIQLVDLRLLPRNTLLSDVMISGVRDALQAGSGVILFLNRRGFASALLCRDCGTSPRCQRCDVTLTLHRADARLTCRYCGSSQRVPHACPTCRAARLEPVGFGTERIEEQVRLLFPDARVARLDRDTVQNPSQAAAIRQAALAGEVDILIGTQMLFQGSPWPPAGFVGIPLADAGLHLPDFRAAERAYHTLLDAVGLARSAEAGGRVILQSYLPTHPAIAAVTHHNGTLFYDQELAFRKALGYPPYTHLISLHISGKNAQRVKEASQWWADSLRHAVSRRSIGEAGWPTRQDNDQPQPRASEARLSPSSDRTGDIMILGPIPSPVAKIRGRHRWQLLVKSVDATAARATVKATLDELEAKNWKRGLKFEVDVDPVEMM
ncbi:MAG: primosomal protein N' [Nitrospiraceae bacterium]